MAEVFITDFFFLLMDVYIETMDCSSDEKRKAEVGLVCDRKS